MTRAPVTRAPQSARQSDLFGPTFLPGLAYGADIISHAEEAALIARIEAAELTPFQFQQWEGKRLTRSFGWTYDFKTGGFAPGEPIPDWIEPLRRKASHFAGLAPEDFQQLLLIHYGAGAGIGWHRDRPVFDHVVGVSLGAAATLRFRRRAGQTFDREKAELGARSIYHLSGEARDGWEHSIAAMAQPRWSITLRSLRQDPASEIGGNRDPARAHNASTTRQADAIVNIARR